MGMVFLFFVLYNYGLQTTEGFLGGLARTVATNALAGGLAAATGAQQQLQQQQTSFAAAAGAAPPTAQPAAAGECK